MKICIWRTGHEIADTVADAVWFGGFEERVFCFTEDLNDDAIANYDVHIGYGILRGMDDVMRACKAADKPFIHIDKGYWKPGHYDGYYRISLNGTQQTINLGDLPLNVRRWEKLGLKVEEREPHLGSYSVICPPTDHAAKFFDVDVKSWTDQAIAKSPESFVLRPKGCERDLDVDLRNAYNVITFNSSVGWEALRRGIPVVSDPAHSIVGAWEKMLDGRQTLMESREHLFSCMSGLQLTLDEMRAGRLMPIIEQLLNARAA